MNAAHAALYEFEMLYGVGEEHVGALDSGVFQNTVQQGTGWADERTSLKILLVAGLFFNHHDAGGMGAFAEYGLGGVAE